MNSDKDDADLWIAASYLPLPEAVVWMLLRRHSDPDPKTGRSSNIRCGLAMALFIACLGLIWGTAHATGV